MEKSGFRWGFSTEKPIFVEKSGLDVGSPPVGRFSWRSAVIQKQTPLTRCLICLSTLGSHLVAKLYAEVEGARGRGAVDVAGVAVRALVEVVLEGVEEVLDAGVELKLDVVVELEVV